MAADYPTVIERMVQEPASATSDGQSATAHRIPDVLQAADRQAGLDAVTGTNPNGGPRSGWALLRIARHKPTGGGPC